MELEDVAARVAADDLVVRTVQQHADSLLRLARRHSLCTDDAYDAYQRGLEIFLKHAPRLEPATAHQWLHTVVKREAWAVREQRQRLLGADEADLDRLEARDSPSPEDRVLAFDDVARSAEALQRLKPQEVQALWLKASGRSYAEIAEELGWTYTKVNRCITEGRKSFLDRYATIESGAECERWAPVLSAMIDGEADRADLAEVRPHLRNCPSCRATVRAMHEGSSSLAVVLPAALALGSGSTQTEAASFLVRLYEAVAGTIHERAATTALKFQAAVDAASVGKVTAVAASAAAFAGGSAVVAETHRPPSHNAAAVSESAAKPTAPPRIAAPSTASLAALPAPAAHAPSSSAARRPRKAAPSGRKQAAPAGAKRSSASQAAADEFAPGGAPSARRPASPAVVAASPRAAEASRPARSSSQTAAETEFTP
jgi:RNA polymerase sigma factor (sigma-70 family)